MTKEGYETLVFAMNALCRIGDLAHGESELHHAMAATTQVIARGVEKLTEADGIPHRGLAAGS